MSSTLLTVLAPPDATVAPPGYYMVFVVSSSGVPSVAQFVLMTGASPPTDTLASGQTLYQVRVCAHRPLLRIPRHPACQTRSHRAHSAHWRAKHPLP